MFRLCLQSSPMPVLPPTDAVLYGAPDSVFAWLSGQLVGVRRVLLTGPGAGRGAGALVASGKRVLLLGGEAEPPQHGAMVAEVPEMRDAITARADIVVVRQAPEVAFAAASCELGLDAIAWWDVPDAACPAHALACHLRAAQRDCYRLARRILPPGALIHMAERVSGASTGVIHLCATTVRLHADLARPFAWVDPLRTTALVVDPHTGDPGTVLVSTIARVA